MRVLYITASGEIGGGNRSLLALWRGLMPCGFVPFAVCPGDGPMRAACSDLGVASSVVESVQPSWRDPVASWAGYARWSAVLREWRPALVHANHPLAARSIAMAAARLDLPVVCHVRFPLSLEETRWIFRRVPKPAGFLFNSRSLQREVGPLLRRACPRAEQIVVPNAVDLDEFHPSAAVERDPLTVGVVANLAPIKRLEDFLQMARIILDRGHGCQFRIIGDDITRSGYRDRLLDCAARLQVNGHVSFEGFRRDVARALGELAIVVSASQYESFGRSLIEAMACGRPVVATAVGGVPEVVEDGSTGLLVPPGDPARLAGAVECLLRDAVLRRTMGRRGRARVEELFAPAASAAAVRGLYQRVREGRASDDSPWSHDSAAGL